jgi:hypothetical protein
VRQDRCVASGLDACAPHVFWNGIDGLLGVKCRFAQRCQLSLLVMVGGDVVRLFVKVLCFSCAASRAVKKEPRMPNAANGAAQGPRYGDGRSKSPRPTSRPSSSAVAQTIPHAETQGYAAV